MAGQHHISALAGIGRPTMLPDRILCNLPDGHLLIALLLDIPANLDNLRVDADARNCHTCDGWAFRRLSAIGHRANHLAFGGATGDSVEHWGSEWCRFIFDGRGYGYWRGQIGITARGIAIVIGLDVDTADID